MSDMLHPARIQFVPFVQNQNPRCNSSSTPNLGSFTCVSEMVRTGVKDIPAVLAAGGQPTPNGISVGGWKIESFHSPMIGETEIDQYKAELGGVINIPEIVFGNSHLELVHEASGVALSFNALDALKGWQVENLPPLQVELAGEWQEARRNEIEEQGAKQLEYDWTYTTGYGGTVQHRAPENGKEVNLDPPPEFSESTEQIDWELLTSQDPILFFDSFTLYESELNDSGICQLEVKVRCMPRCWFVLVRFWLRVDGNMVRLRESRIFCRFDDESSRNLVMREIRNCEGTFNELKGAGAPPEGPAYRDSDTTATVMQAIAPTGVKVHKKEKLDLTGLVR